MKVYGKHYRTIWENASGILPVSIIDQRFLPHEFIIEELISTDDFYNAIRDMHLRGAPLIGAAAGYAMYAAAIEAAVQPDFDKYIIKSANKIKSARPTAVNLFQAVDTQLKAILSENHAENKIQSALDTARSLTESDVKYCSNIGRYGETLIRDIYERKGNKTVNILTHCNAGWLATVDYGTATAPIYFAHNNGIKVHVWVDETRPRNQGAKLTAWELLQEGIPHTVIADNTGGHLMQHGMVDLVIVGSDRTTFTGDVANKIGTYLKALAAKDNNIPFYVALPSTTIDWELEDGILQIPIESRDPDEVRFTDGLRGEEIIRVLVPPAGSNAANFAFDVTPARLITGLITERGICSADCDGIFSLYPEMKKQP